MDTTENKIPQDGKIDCPIFMLDYRHTYAGKSRARHFTVQDSIPVRVA